MFVAVNKQNGSLQVYELCINTCYKWMYSNASNGNMELINIKFYALYLHLYLFIFNDVYKHKAQLAKVSNDTEPPLEIPHRLPKQPAPSLAAGKYPIQESPLKRVA